MKRRLFASTALVSAVAACAVPGTTTTSSVPVTMLQIQAILGLLEGLGAGVAAAVPGAATIMSILQPWFNSANDIFQGMNAGMSNVLAGSAVQQIANVLTLAVNAVQTAVNDPHAPVGVQALAMKLQEARDILAALVVFAEGVSGVVQPATMSSRMGGLLPSVPVWVHR